MPFGVSPQDLTTHAAHLDGLADRLDTALSAAQQASMSDQAYGLLCSFLPPTVNPTEQEGLRAIRAAGEGVRLTADNVRTTARQYEDDDDRNARSFEPLREANAEAPAHVRKIMQ